MNGRSMKNKLDSSKNPLLDNKKRIINEEKNKRIVVMRPFE
jgi:hypothetical protein